MGQDVHIAPATRPPYAPSPSLLGSNDPLGRTSARAPLVSFGFGGKILTCFHDSTDLSTGFDVALCSRRTTNITMRVLYKVLPEYALEAKEAEYPGPLISDPGSPATGLIRTGVSTQAKAKKTRVIKYLEERADEISRGIAYVSDSTERQRVEGKLVLLRLLKIMVENDGSLSGSPQIDATVRAALLPRIASTADRGNKDASTSFPTPAFAPSMPDAYGVPSTLPTNSETPISVSTLLPSSLDRIQEFLVRGERHRAYHYALDERLWPHAMIIASGIDKEAWKEVVNEFLRTELGVHDRNALSNRSRDPLPAQTNGREWLRVAYSLFSGLGPSAVQQLMPINSLSKATTGVPTPVPTFTHVTPMSPNFPSVVAAQIPTESLSKWPEIVATMVTSPMTPDWSATLTALGDCLATHSLMEGAHVCYLLSLQTSIMGGIGSPGVRMVLLGSQTSYSGPTSFRDSDPVIFSEIAEFAFSLKAVPKGQEPFHGFPHLQAYKLTRAAYLAEIGQVQAATRYCEAIAALMNRPSPYFNSALIEQLKNLTGRLIGAPHSDKPASWIGGKVNKPSLDSIGSWLEGRLTKFIAGEGDDPSLADVSRAQQSAFTGPFASYSSITSATTSASSSPAPTMINSYSMSATQLPRRSGSAMALSSAQTHIPVDRASSAMECYRPTHSVSPAPPKTAPLHPTGMYNSCLRTNGSTVNNGFSSAYASEPSSRKTSLEITAEEETGDWWNSLSSTDSAPTPTFAAFHPVGTGASQDGFISLMDDPPMSVASSPSGGALHSVEGVEDDEDDLGLSNNAHRKNQENNTKVSGDSKPVEAPVEATDKAEQKQAQTAGAFGSWLNLSRIWKRSDTPGPIKASLGEETSFYYDKELKRWVNKKATASGAQPSAPPPPPTRAQTTSPSRANGRQAGISNGHASAPPLAPTVARTASAIDLNTSATSNPPVRMRSNLVPTEVISMPNTPLPGVTGMPPPPPIGRPRSQAAKKGVRSKYVDVFQQGSGA
ncbi:Sec23-binding domain of Sec16-domain-containing protein [Phlebopus sp. FC_14]|nr:Sec23-binding domain of Sec16-domain-containing protein [Phlebopus sp. FC_14]